MPRFDQLRPLRAAPEPFCRGHFVPGAPSPSGHSRSRSCCVSAREPAVFQGALVPVCGEQRLESKTHAGGLRLPLGKDRAGMRGGGRAATCWSRPLPGLQHHPARWALSSPPSPPRSSPTLHLLRCTDACPPHRPACPPLPAPGHPCPPGGGEREELPVTTATFTNEHSGAPASSAALAVAWTCPSLCRLLAKVQKQCPCGD